MGRRNTNTAIPQRQRSCLPANQELRAALKGGHRPKSFGIRRLLTEQSQDPIVELFRDLQDDNVFPVELEPRSSLHVTLLPRRRMDRQFARGIVAGYEIGKKLPATKREIDEVSTPDLTVTLGRATVLKSRIVVLSIKSEQLEDEYRATREALSRAGLKGLMRDTVPLHITIAESSDLISRRNEENIKCILNDVMPIHDDVALESISFYPDGQQVA